MIIYAGKVTNTLMQFCLYSKPPHRRRPQGPTTFQTLPPKLLDTCVILFSSPLFTRWPFICKCTHTAWYYAVNQTEKKEHYPSTILFPIQTFCSIVKRNERYHSCFVLIFIEFEWNDTPKLLPNFSFNRERPHVSQWQENGWNPKIFWKESNSTIIVWDDMPHDESLHPLK